MFLFQQPSLPLTRNCFCYTLDPEFLFPPTLEFEMQLSRRRQWHPTPVLLLGKSHGWRSLVGCCSWGHEELDMTEQLCFRFSLSCIGEGNGNPLQCPCLENLRDGEAWCAAVFGVAQSRTRLKRLSSSSSSSKSLLENLPQIFVQVYRFQWVMMQRQ